MAERFSKLPSEKEAPAHILRMVLRVAMRSWRGRRNFRPGALSVTGGGDLRSDGGRAWAGMFDIPVVAQFQRGRRGRLHQFAQIEPLRHSVALRSPVLVAFEIGTRRGR